MFYDLTIPEIISQTVDSVRDGQDTHWLGETDHVLLQYTGLHDKNGKEIYESDVVIIHESGWHETKEGTRQLVHWCGCGFGFAEVGEDVEKGHICCAWATGSDLEVIGNIYENPELLEVK